MVGVHFIYLYKNRAMKAVDIVLRSGEGMREA
jgi:hypothetical protein